MKMTPELERLIAWIAENTEAEPLSSMMPYGAIWNVNSHSLLDAIRDIYEIDEEEIGAIVDKAQTYGLPQP